MALLDTIMELDRELFFFINHRLNNPFFDLVLPYARNAITWIPLYILLLYLIIRAFNQKGVYWILAAAVIAILTDAANSRVIKHIIMRPRPCNDEVLRTKVHLLLANCPFSSSFPSSHAVNHFAFAAFFFYTLREQWGNKTAWIFLWAFIICFSQVYVGVHYPLDIICGGIFGFLIGLSFARIFNSYFPLNSAM